MIFFSGRQSVDECWQVFHSILEEAKERFVPCVSPIRSSRRLPKDIRRLLSLKRKLYQTDRKRYRQASKNYDLAVRLFLESKEEHIVQRRNTRKFYAYVRKNLRRKGGVSPMINENGDLITDDKKKADFLNDFFSSNFTLDNGQL